MTNDDWAYIAGVVDAEGSFQMNYQKAKRGKYDVTIRRVRARIKTTDKIIVPYIASLLDAKYSGKSYYEITFYGNKLRFLIQGILPYLYVKRRQAKICLQAINIKDSDDFTPYTEDQKKEWDDLLLKLSDINKRGKEADIGERVSDHVFSLSWLAGLIDGDGTVTTGRFNSKNKKPYIKISLTDHFCVEYLAKILSLKVGSCRGVGNRRDTKQIRMMSRAILRWVPKLLPYIKFKHDRVSLALEIATIRSSDYGNQIDSRIPELLGWITRLNNHCFHELVYSEGILYEIYDVSCPYALNVRPDILIYSDEFNSSRELFNKIISNKIGSIETRSIRPKDCELRICSNRDVRPFYEKFHYQGHVNSVYHVGVFYDLELIACLSIKRPTRQKSGDWEISRMACNYDFRVHGIWSYIMKWIKKKGIISGKLITFSDNRLMVGNVYKIMGMTYVSDVKPDYYWVKNSTRFHKSALRKSKAEKDLGKTEVELRSSQGFHKVFDLGKKKWQIII